MPSVVAHSPHADVWMADNASSDDSVEFVKNQYPSIKITENDQNYGFAEGYNQALKRIDADIYVLLNSDVEVPEDWMTPILKELAQDEQIVASMPKIQAWERKGEFEHAGASGGFIDRWGFPFCRGRMFSEVEQDEGQYNDTREVFWATGACLFIRANAFHEAGGFDGDFFAHMEEIDLCWRLKNRGHKITVCPESTVYHLGGGTLSYMSPRKTYLNFRNNLFMIYKNKQGNLLVFVWFRMLLDGIAAMKFLLGGQFAHFSAVIKAHFHFYGKLGTLSRKRKAIQPLVKSPNRTGIYQGSIVKAFFLGGSKKFSDLDQQKFEA